MKPLPVPRGTCCTVGENISRCEDSVVMCTTDGPMRLKTSMCATSSAASGPRVATGRGAASVRLYEVCNGHNSAAAHAHTPATSVTTRQVGWGERFIAMPSMGWERTLLQTNAAATGARTVPAGCGFQGFWVAFRRVA